MARSETSRSGSSISSPSSCWVSVGGGAHPPAGVQHLAQQQGVVHRRAERPRPSSASSSSASGPMWPAPGRLASTRMPTVRTPARSRTASSSPKVTGVRRPWHRHARGGTSTGSSDSRTVPSCSSTAARAAAGRGAAVSSSSSSAGGRWSRARRTALLVEQRGEGVVGLAQLAGGRGDLAEHSGGGRSLRRMRGSRWRTWWTRRSTAWTVTLMTAPCRLRPLRASRALRVRDQCRNVGRAASSKTWSTQKQSVLTVCLRGAQWRPCRPPCACPRSSAPARMRQRLLEATRRVPGRARLERYVDHARLPAGRRQPRRPAPPLPDQGRPGAGRGRAPDRRTPARRCSARTADLPTGGGRTRAVLGVLAELFTGPLFVAAAELWMAARTDPALREAVADARDPRRSRHPPLHRRRARRRRVACRATASWCRPPSTSCAASGWPTSSPTTSPAATASSTTGPTPSRRPSRPTAPDHPTRGPRVTDPKTLPILRRPRRRGRRPRRDGRRPRRRRLAHARPRPRAGTSRPRSPTWPGPTRSRCPPPPTRPPGTATCSQAIEDPDGFVDAEALRLGAAAPRGAARALARRAAAPGPGAQRPPVGGEDAVVRPPDGAAVDGQRPLHGDLGPRPRRRRGARRRRRARTTGSVTSSTSVCAPAPSPSSTAASRRPPRRSASS